ncbi:MAG TPA: Pvc16 family protein [Ramlibacter sp.]|nr:Pvc16 family protein [Ramlibacter sp.]
MIALADLLLFRLFRWQVAALSADTQVSFQPPDDDWRTAVPGITDMSGAPASSLNVYLADVRENRRLRSNERERVTVHPDIHETPPARRVDCHYLISAWSGVSVSPATEPTIDEHALLSEAALALSRIDALDPVLICEATRPGLPAIVVPQPLVEELLPVSLLPVEGFPKLGEFWGTMGQSHRWKPCLYTVVTVALKEAPRPVGPMVTTIYSDTLQRGFSATRNTRFHIGGTVHVSAADLTPVPGCWVELLTVADTLVTLVRADAAGRYVFADVPAGNYHLRARVPALPLPPSPPAPPQPALATSPVRAITVPEPSGSYDIVF